MARARDTRTRDRALFITVGLFVVLVGYAGHQYFASEGGRVRSIVRESRARPSSQALAALGCDDPKVLTSAEVAQLVHAGMLSGLTPIANLNLALCPARKGQSISCDDVGDAYAKARGELPVQLLVLQGSEVRCSVVRIQPADHRVETLPE